MKSYRLIQGGKIKVYSLAIYMILFITFFVHLCAFIYHPIKLMFVLLIAAVVLLNSGHGIIKKMSTLDYLYMLTLIPFFFNNQDIQRGSWDNTIFQICATLVFLLLKNCSEWISLWVKFVVGACFFMVFCTVLFWLVPPIKVSVLSTVFPGNESILTTTAAIGLTHHYSANGNFMAIAVGAFYWLGNDRKKTKYWIIIVVAVGCLLLTQKRGPLIWGSLALLVSYYVYNSNKKSTRIFKIIAFVVVAFAFLNLAEQFIPELSVVFERFKIDDTSNSDITFLSGREVLYEAAWKLFRQNPWLGVGWSGYANAARIYTGIEEMTAHNIYLQLLAETGVVGFLIFVTLYICAITRGIKCLQAARKEKINVDERQQKIMAFALFFIIYNVAYGMSGLVLTDIMMVYMTMFSIALFRNYDFYYQT